MGSLAQTAQERGKMTRLAPSADAQAIARMTENSEQYQVPSSFYSRLNWKHYAAGGIVAGALILGVAVLLVSMLQRDGTNSSKSSQPSPTPVEQVKTESNEENEVADPVQPRQKTDSVPEQSSVGESVRGPSNNNTVSSVPEAQTKGSGKARAPVRNKPRRGAKDLMEGP